MKRILIIALMVLHGLVLKAQENDPELLQIVEGLGAKMEKLVVAEEIDALVDMYSESSQYLPDQGRIYSGLTEIRKVWELTFQVDVVDFELTTSKVGGSKDRIYETGSGFSKISYNGQESVQKFKYVNIWERQTSGEYKLIVDIYNRDIPTK